MYIILIHQSTCILSYHLRYPQQILCQQDSGGIKGHLTFSGTWTSMAHYEEQNVALKVLYWEIPGSGSINKSPFIQLAHICAVSSTGRGKLSAWAQIFTGTEGIVWKAENDTYHAFTLYSNLDILYVLIALSLSPFPTCTYTVFFLRLVIISIEQSSAELGELAVTHLLEHYCLVLYTRQIGYEWDLLSSWALYLFHKTFSSELSLQ